MYSESFLFDAYMMIIDDRPDLTPFRLSTSKTERHVAQFTFGFSGSPGLVAVRIDQLEEALARPQTPRLVQLQQGKTKKLIEGKSVFELARYLEWLDKPKAERATVQFSHAMPQSDIAALIAALEKSQIILEEPAYRLAENYLNLVRMPKSEFHRLPFHEAPPLASSYPGEAIRPDPAQDPAMACHRVREALVR